MFKIFKELSHGSTINFDRLLKWLLRIHQTIDSTVHLITIWVAHVVLHVPDDHIMPVGNVKRSILAENGVSRTEITIATTNKFSSWSSPDFARLILLFFKAVAMKIILLDTQITNSVTENEILLHLIWEVCARNNRVSGYRTNFLIHQRKHFEAIAIGTDLIRTATCAIICIEVTPLIKTGAMGIRAIASD